MTPVIVAVEGYDGSGKSTITAALVAGLQGHGRTVATVGRRGPDATPALESLTNLILRTDGHVEHLDPDAEAHIRLARACQRIAIARASTADVVILDRWLGSDLGQLGDATRAEYSDDYSSLASAVDISLYLEGPFDVLWSRVSSRPQEMSPKERLGEEVNRGLHDRFLSGMALYERLGGHVARIDCTLPVDAVGAQALELTVFELG